MPTSRKKAQGKQRKARQERKTKAKTPNHEDEVEMPCVVCSHARLSNCTHGHHHIGQNPVDLMICDRYVRRVLETDAKDEYFSVQIMEERCVESDFIFHSCPKRGELAKQMLLSIAVDMILELLSNVDASGDMLPIVFTNFTLQNVLYQIMLVESIEKAKNPNASKNPNAVMDELLKMQDMVTNICNTLHYLRRRIKCTCLDDVYKNFRKDNSRSVLCHGCHKWCEKKEVWVCQCKVAQFCSSSSICHKKSWPFTNKDAKV